MPIDGAFLYILRCADGSLYVGLTRRGVEERVSEHNLGRIDTYTARRLPVELIFHEHYARVDEAVAAERRLKGWSRAKKIAYILRDFEALSDFARSRPKVGEGSPAGGSSQDPSS